MLAMTLSQSVTQSQFFMPTPLERNDEQVSYSHVGMLLERGRESFRDLQVVYDFTLDAVKSNLSYLPKTIDRYNNVASRTDSLIGYLFEDRNSPKSEYQENYNVISGKLINYMSLDENWDGYGGVAPNSKVIHSALKFLTRLKKDFFVLPQPMLAGSGEVGFYWDINECHAEVVFENEGVFSFLLMNKEMVYGEDDYSLELRLPDMLRNFLISGAFFKG